MEIDFDPAKDAVNRAKHGLPLAEAVGLEWEEAFILPDDRLACGEQRLRIYAMLAGRLHMAAVTFRGPVLRVISLRKANRREVKRYEQLPREA